MSPAELIIKEFRGVRPLARKLGINPSTVCRWSKPNAEGGTGGNIPQRYFVPLLEIAKHEGRAISLNDLVFGRQA
jgi:hypothetical protein